MSKKQDGAYVMLHGDRTIGPAIITEFVANANHWQADTGGNLNLFSETTSYPIATFASGSWSGVKLSATSGSISNGTQAVS